MSASYFPKAGSPTQRLVRKLQTKLGTTFTRVTTITTFPVMKDAIIQGVGIGPFLEKSVVSEDGLVCLEIEEMPEALPICLVVNADKADLNLIRSFIKVADETTL